MTGARSVLKSVASQAEWQWANDEKILLPLKNAVQGVDACLNGFAMEMLAADIREVRGRYEHSIFLEMCKVMTDELEPNLRKLDIEVRSLNSMQVGRQKVVASQTSPAAKKR